MTTVTVNHTEFLYKNSMSSDTNTVEKKSMQKGKTVVSNSGGAIYGIGVLGTAVYYIVHATNFWMGVVGLIKAVFWPGFLLYRVFEMLHM